MRKLSPGKILFAVCLVGLGVLLLLVNTGIISMEITEAIVFFYPFLLVVLGVVWLVESLIPHSRRGHLFWGVLFIVLGGLLVADRLEMITFTLDMVWKLWPLVLVYIGFRMLTGHGIRVMINTDKKEGHTHTHKHKQGRSFGRIVSEVSYKDENWTVEPIDRWSGVGDIDFDFTKAFIPDKETKIRLFGWVGDIKILIPEDVEFSVEANANVGDIHIGDYGEEGLLKEFYYTTNGYGEAVRKLAFDFDFRVLDLRVDRV